ncbi:DnaA N-terminal domain-containing protein [Lentibacillus sp. Marseille-P4043]|uniref:DnaA N-terminal domain-containing protein n=1 Tax=Lentibacillus sp. Marseille-P4043 TaxID=2040293 RepID=UPI000D0BCAF1|nr:DnaA N-terminal domain-containing protein [Lentibacillus sp. Marseille-P4043]
MENDVWKEVLDVISDRISKPTFETWFKPSKLKIEQTSWLIITSNEFAKDWLEMRYISLVKDAIYEVTKKMPEVVFTAEEEDMALSYSDRKIDHILAQINNLSLIEKENLFDVLKKYFLLSHDEAEFHLGRESQFERNNQLNIGYELDRIDRLESEVEQIKNQLLRLNN